LHLLPDFVVASHLPSLIGWTFDTLTAGGVMETRAMMFVSAPHAFVTAHAHSKHSNKNLRFICHPPSSFLVRLLQRLQQSTRRQRLPWARCAPSWPFLDRHTTNSQAQSTAHASENRNSNISSAENS